MRFPSPAARTIAVSREPFPVLDSERLAIEFGFNMKSEIFHHPNWAVSTEKRSLELWESSVLSTPTTLFVGGVHGDEPEGVRLAEELLAWLHKNNKLVQRSWKLIPCLNPDGFHRKQRTNARGVDLNRNFPSADWSPQAPAERYNPGPSPKSELETQALCALLEQTKPELVVHFHSWKPSIVFTGASARHFAERFAKGNSYPVQEDIGYPTPGSLGNYGWHSLGIPVICLEAQEHSNLDTVWGFFGPGLIDHLTAPPRE